MNWIGTSVRALLLAGIAAAIGFAAYGALLARGLEAPWVIAALAGLAAALASRDRSVMRGLVVGTLAVWVGAAAQAFFSPLAAGEPVWTGLARFHETLTPLRWLSFAATAGIAIAVGAWSPFAPRAGAQPR